MQFSGKSLECRPRGEGIVELRFDLKGESVNKFNQLTLSELEQAVEELAKAKDVKGLLVTSGKSVFIVGADITEFLPNFRKSEAELKAWIQRGQRIFSRFEDLPFPSVAALNGYCLGGGLEAAMACTYRVASTAATVGQPEVKLGLIPGFGGTVRLPRIVGVDNALDLIASGRDVKAEEALKLRLVQAVVAPEKLEEAALALLRRKMADERWTADRQEKLEPVKLNFVERAMSFTVGKGMIAAKAGPHYPAPVRAAALMERTAPLGRDEALDREAEAFSKLARTPEAESLVGIFLADQFVKKQSG
ncbi:MAG: enoyl-CoA hydratase/isomerase family protein, partial [Candidatus Lambdaproteobacteria bacterium]|nr:enoyl-CoA hydratase/isomerase family protein [Candidatus Lambdaproteobacteria bacterium]